MPNRTQLQRVTDYDPLLEATIDLIRSLHGGIKRTRMSTVNRYEIDPLGFAMR